MAAMARTRELSEPLTLLSLPDDDLNQALARVSLAHHGTVASVCSRFRDLVLSDEFQLARRSAGCAEPSVMVFGGEGGNDEPEQGNMRCRALVTNSWVELAPSIHGVADHPMQQPNPRLLASASGGDERARKQLLWQMGWKGVRKPFHTVIGEDLFVGGGYFCGNFGACSELLHAYSFRENSWRKVGECPALQYVACENIHGRMILAGGEPNASNGVTSAVQLFNPADASWTELPRLPHAVRSATSFVSGGCLYVIGGIGYENADEEQGSEDDEDEHESPLAEVPFVQKFDLGANAWTLCASMPAEVMGTLSTCGTLHNGRYTLIGVKGPPNPQPLFALLMQNAMGVAPAQNRANEIPMVVMADYDLKKDEWRVLRQFPRPSMMPRNGLSAFSRPNGILIVGSLGNTMLIKDDGTCSADVTPPCFEGARITIIEAVEFELTLQHFKLRGQADRGARASRTATDQEEQPALQPSGFVSAATLVAEPPRVGFLE